MHQNLIKLSCIVWRRATHSILSQNITDTTASLFYSVSKWEEKPKIFSGDLRHGLRQTHTHTEQRSISLPLCRDDSSRPPLSLRDDNKRGGMLFLPHGEQITKKSPGLGAIPRLRQASHPLCPSTLPFLRSFCLLLFERHIRSCCRRKSK